MADISKTVAIIFEGDDRASVVADKLAGSMDRTNRATELAAKQAEQTAAAEEKWAASSAKAMIEQERLAEATKQQSDASQQAEVNAGRFVLALKAIAASVVVKEFLDANSAIEKLQLGFTSVSGSSAAAAKEMEYIRRAANEFGISTVDAGNAYLKLAAATKGTALEGEGARIIFEAVTKQLALLGGSSHDVSGALVQVSQGISKGKFELEDLKSIAERMPGFFDKFAQSLGKTTPELFSLISAGKIGGPEFLKFAESINDGIGGIPVNTYEAGIARMKNATADLAVAIGDTGAFDVITKAINTTAGLTQGLSNYFRDLANAAEDAIVKIRAGDFDGIIEGIRKSLEQSDTNASKFFGLDVVNESLAETERLARRAAEAVEKSARENQSDAETSRLLRLANAQKDAIRDIEEAYKALGINVEKVNVDLIAKFQTVAALPTATGKEILAGLKTALRSADTYSDIERIGGALSGAFAKGQLSADEFRTATTALAEQQKRVGDAMERTTGTSKAQAEELKKTEEAARKAEEAAAKLALEYEKLASNERIKAMEFSVNFNIAKLEEDTKRVQAAFDSINNTMDSTADVIKTALGMLKDFGSMDWGAIRIIEQQLEKENQLRRENFDLQKQLALAQIENLHAQTRQLENGNPLIKIDGAGLQPHLEAFMWEILKVVQVRVNRDGLKLLLGV